MDYAAYTNLDGHDRSTTWDTAVRQLLDQSQEEERERLAQELEQIEDQLERRDTVHEDIVSELEWKIERYTDRLEHLYMIGKGRRDGTREQLKDRIESFYTALREEQREHWRDRQELERERRELRRRLAEVGDEALSELL